MAELHPDPLESLQLSPSSPSWVKRGRREKGEEGKGEGPKDAQYLKCVDAPVSTTRGYTETLFGRS